MSEPASRPQGLVVAPDLPDIIPQKAPRKGLLGFILRNPAMAAGIFILGFMMFIAVFAPLLFTMVAITASIAGLAIGLVSGMVRWSDGIIMRIVDGMMSIPPILLAIALMALTRGSVGNVILAITLAEIPRVARLVRGVVLTLREQPYVDAAIAAGTRTPMVILRHILPNTLAPMIVQATYICASAMIVEAILSFIGAGIPPTIPSWGNIMADGRTLWQVRPHIVMFPAIFLSLTVLAVNLVGDGLRDILDPRMAKRI